MNLTVVKRDGSEHTILFDAVDAEIVLAHKWAILCPPNRHSKYAITTAKRADGVKTTARMHNLIMGQLGIDHINHDGLDNRRSNLRPANRSQQGGNQFPRKGSSQYKGVCWDKAKRKWKATIMVDHLTINLGRYATELEAARAYDEKALATWGEFSMLNFPVTEAISRSQAS